MPNAQIEQLIDLMDSGYPAKREQARSSLLALGPEAISPLLDIVNASRMYEQNVFSAATLLSCLTMLVLPVLLLFRIAGAISNADLAVLSFTTALLVWIYNRLGGPSVKGLGRYNDKAKRLKRRTEHAREVLLAMDDIRCIDPICESLSMDGTRYVVPELQKLALCNLLPKLKASDAHLFSSSSRAKLCHWLCIGNARQHADFLILILRALEQTGGEEAITAVSGLANDVATSPEGIRVRAEARHCLAALSEQAEVKKAERTLLRASTAPDEGNSLLRPASGHRVANEQNLLRSADSIPEEMNLENRT
jgi:hypothetical protein